MLKLLEIFSSSSHARKRRSSYNGILILCNKILLHRELAKEHFKPFFSSDLHNKFIKANHHINLYYYMSYLDKKCSQVFSCYKPILEYMEPLTYWTTFGDYSWVDPRYLGMPSSYTQRDDETEIPFDVGSLWIGKFQWFLQTRGFFICSKGVLSPYNPISLKS